MKRTLTLLAAFALLAASSHAQSVTIRISGTVLFASASSGPFASVVPGDLAVWEADVSVPGFDLAPGQFTNYTMVPGSYTITVGGVVDSPNLQTVGVQNDFPVADGMFIFMHGLGSGGFQELTLSDSTGNLFSSTDLTMLGGSYPGSLLDSGAWDIFPSGGGSISISYCLIEIITGCATPAAATFRNDAAGLNLPNFTATTAVIGGTFNCTVDNTGTGATVAWVLGYVNPLDVAFAFGSVLVDTSTAELLNVVPQPGAGLVNFSVPVPADPSLCGFTLSTQGLGFAPGLLRLYNAYDLTVGI